MYFAVVKKCPLMFQKHSGSNLVTDQKMTWFYWSSGRSALQRKGRLIYLVRGGAWHFKMYSFVTKFSSNLFLGIGKEAFILISRVISYSKHFPVQSEQ